MLAIQLYQKFEDKPNAIRMAKIGVARAEKHLENYPKNQRAYYLGSDALRVLGHSEQSELWAERAIEIAPDDRATRYNLACFYAKKGDKDKALELLSESISSRKWMENDPDLDVLRDDPRYHAIVASLSEE